MEAKKEMTGFISNKSNYIDAKAFMDHLNECEECREEFEIQYLINVGMQRLEKGENFDLYFEINEKMKATSVKIKRMEIMEKFRNILKTFIMITMLAAIVYGIVF